MAKSNTPKRHESQRQNKQIERGRKRDLLKDVISTNKSFDYSMETDYKRVFSPYHPNILPSKADHLG